MTLKCPVCMAVVHVITDAKSSWLKPHHESSYAQRDDMGRRCRVELLCAGSGAKVVVLT